MIECLSDNRNRTVAEVRHAFTKTGGNPALTVQLRTCLAKRCYLL